ncbi:MAG: hypothetical protein K1Y02_21665 [Candidatus Hydrogenedentes bacterium]|nr:hypothetical protein [Candidatus Hydrogenedentota bacterium]
MDLRTWWPCQSERARDICTHMSSAERWGLAVLNVSYAAWLVYAVLWRLALLVLTPTGEHARSAFFMGVLTLAFTFMFLSLVRSYLLRTRYGRKYPYLADQLELFTLGRRGTTAEPK